MDRASKHGDVHVALIAVGAASASARICLYQATAEALEAGLRE